MLCVPVNGFLLPLFLGQPCLNPVGTGCQCTNTFSSATICTLTPSVPVSPQLDDLSSLALQMLLLYGHHMSTVTEIKEAIANLSPQEYCELIGDLQLFADDEWDTQMKTDASSGKLDFVDWSVKQTKVGGTQVPLDHILDERKA